MMTWYRKQNIERRLEKLARAFAAHRMPTRDEVIREAAFKQLSAEDLDILWRLIKDGRQSLAHSEREAQALVAYRSAIENATRSFDG
jgi:hypothetical protein